MAASLDEARNEVLTLFQTAFISEAAKLGVDVNKNITVGFFDPDAIPGEGKNPANKPWARMTMAHVNSRRPLGARRITRDGVLTLQIFFYRNKTNADAMCQRLGDAVAKAVERHTGQVSLFGITPAERPINNGFAQTDVAARFQYTTFVER